MVPIFDFFSFPTIKRFLMLIGPFSNVRSFLKEIETTFESILISEVKATKELQAEKFNTSLLCSYDLFGM